MKWQDEIVSIESLKHPDRNVRQHSDKQIAELVRSLNMFGQFRRVIADEDNVVLVGNGLLDAMISAGFHEVEIKRLINASENEKKKLMIADNRTFSLGVDNHVVLDEFFKELQGDLDIPGYDENLLNVITADAQRVTETISTFGIVTQEEHKRIQDASADKSNEILANENKNDQNKNFELSGTYEGQRVGGTGEASPYIQSDASAYQVGGGDPIPRRFVVCPKCGEKIYID